MPFDPKDVEHLREEIDAKQEGRGSETPEELKARLISQHEAAISYTPRKPPTKLSVIGDDEPTFTFRAKDIFSTMVLVKYLEIVESFGPDDYEFQERIGEKIAEFKKWQHQNTHKVRYPD